MGLADVPISRAALRWLEKKKESNEMHEQLLGIGAVIVACRVERILSLLFAA